MHTHRLSSLWKTAALVLWGLVPFQACGGESPPPAQPACGPGTALVNGQCVVAAECGEGTVLKNGKCVPEGSGGSSTAGSGPSAGSGPTAGSSPTAGTGGSPPQGGFGGNAGNAGAQTGGAGVQAGGQAGSPEAGAGGTPVFGGSGGQGGEPSAGTAGVAGSGLGGEGGQGGAAGSGGAPKAGIPLTCAGVPNWKHGCCGTDGNAYDCENADSPTDIPKKIDCSGLEKCSFFGLPPLLDWGSFNCSTTPKPTPDGVIKNCTAELRGENTFDPDDDPTDEYPRECGVW